MNLSDLFNSRAIATYWTESPNNAIPYLGRGFFPPRKKMGLDLKWIHGEGGQPVALKNSNFDAMPTLRHPLSVEFTETEMPFFREATQVKEQDEQDIMRILDANDPYALPILSRIYRSPADLIEGANVIPEMMIWQLLAPADGEMGISIVSDNVPYKYDYDPNGKWGASNYFALSGDSLWSNPATAKPLDNFNTVKKAVTRTSGTTPTTAIMSQATFDMLVQNAQIRSAILAQNATANIFMNDSIVKSSIYTFNQITIVVYDKTAKDANKTEIQFMPDGYVTMVPGGSLGNTWYGTTPEERTLMGRAGADVSIIDTGVAVAVIRKADTPVVTNTTVSEIVLPSFERMNEVAVLKVA